MFFYEGLHLECVNKNLINVFLGEVFLVFNRFENKEALVARFLVFLSLIQTFCGL